MLVITPRSANFEVWRINNKLFVVFGRNERAFIFVVWVVTALGEIFQSGNSKGKTYSSGHNYISGGVFLVSNVITW